MCIDIELAPCHVFISKQLCKNHWKNNLQTKDFDPISSPTTLVDKHFTELDETITKKVSNGNVANIK